MNRHWSAFWRGVASLFDLTGSAYRRDVDAPQPPRRSDAEALAGDREAVDRDGWYWQ